MRKVGRGHWDVGTVARSVSLACISPARHFWNSGTDPSGVWCTTRYGLSTHFFSLDGRCPSTLPWPETCQDSFVELFLLCTSPSTKRFVLVTLSVMQKPTVAHIRTARDIISRIFP